ncbi:hypothetical protein [Streptomyces avicenniae]|uniref:hypothetical protein n=1 Tax=Streptomyces avicenniae TaxID=500153 RepID=UPI000ADE023B|nr:hypothetical protein [Streptomyces avicenniae]
MERFLVSHDYGMGALWWWVRAPSAEDIVLACADVQVVTSEEAWRWARAQDTPLPEVDLDAPHPNPLSSFRATRDAQRDRPGFGALAGRERVHLRAEGEEGVVQLAELGPDGRRLRQVEIGPSGKGVRTGPADWLFNPPSDLYDPDLAPLEIPADTFESAWRAAR